MGLDMYLSGKVYISNSKFINDEMVPNEDFKKIVKVLPEGTYADSDAGGLMIDVPVAYWRKFNALHDYIIKNHNNGEDRCEPVNLNKPELVQLLDILTNLMKEPLGSDYAKENFPTASGFFFGSTAYDEYYIAEVRRTIKILRKLIDSNYDYFVYESSW
jgi:hypothetical protein